MSENFPDPVRGELPAKGTRLYRGSKGGEDGKAGIHWSLRRQIAEIFSRPEDGGHVVEVEVDDPEGQVIPRMSLEFRNYRDQEFMQHKHILNDEQEYHLRPGAKLRVLNRDQLGEHFPEHVEIEHTGRGVPYTNLSQYATSAKVAGDIEDRNMRRFGYKQAAMFTPVMRAPWDEDHPEWEGKDLGYITSPDISIRQFTEELGELPFGQTSGEDMGLITSPKESS